MVLSRLPVAGTWWPNDDLPVAALTVAASAISEEELSDAAAADEGIRVVRGARVRVRTVTPTEGC